MSTSVYLIIFSFSVIASLLSGCLAALIIYPQKLYAELKLDISIEQMVEQEENLMQLFKVMRPEGIGVYSFARKINVYEGSENASLKEKAYINEPDKAGKMYVDFLPRLSKEDRLFFFAHECGHVINDDPIPNTKLIGYGKPEIEQLADYTAASLIMPYSVVLSILKETDFNSITNKKKIRVVRLLQRRFCVSEMTAMKRIKEVQLLEGKLNI